MSVTVTCDCYCDMWVLLWNVNVIVLILWLLDYVTVDVACGCNCDMWLQLWYFTITVTLTVTATVLFDCNMSNYDMLLWHVNMTGSRDCDSVMWLLLWHVTVTCHIRFWTITYLSSIVIRRLSIAPCGFQQWRSSCQLPSK